MRTIWKWTLTTECTLDMPQGAKILTVQEQHGEPQLWALVDSNAPQERRTFRVYGTGHCCATDPGDYIGTFQLHGGGLVFHVFEANVEAETSERSE
jgi:hypothetical protein